jgi:pimeloyl-ACP methyl ester carboxylesterase
MKNDRISPFRIDVAPELLSDLRQRLKNTRWSYQVQGTSWEAGTDLNYLKELVAYWHDTYDWRKHEAALNQFAHFKTEVDDMASTSSTKEGMKKWAGSSKVPAAFALFPADISRPPREWAERFFNVQRWTEMPRGGHFAAMEEPELLADDIRTWFRTFRDGRAKEHI